MKLSLSGLPGEKLTRGFQPELPQLRRLCGDLRNKKDESRFEDSDFREKTRQCLWKRNSGISGMLIKKGVLGASTSGMNGNNFWQPLKKLELGTRNSELETLPS
jgi:hypothetical protein